jgi:hypothetical protein
MKNLKTLTEEYRKGDFEKRLNLFLECPLLRDEFMLIEKKEGLVSSRYLSEPTACQNC